MISCRLTLPLIFGVVASGCGAVLTESQLATVRSFATTSGQYPSLPPRVLDAYARVRQERTILAVAVQRLDTEAIAREAFFKLEKSTEIPEAFHQKSKQVTSALAVLSTYSELLRLLTSEDALGALNDNAEHLGDSLDNAVTLYDEKFHAELPKPGSVAGALARGATGLFVKAKQAQFVRDSVRAARPLIKALTDDIRRLLGPYGSAPTTEKNPFEAEKDEIQATYVADFFIYKPKPLPLEHVRAFDSVLRQVADAQQLADRVLAATNTYAAAHERLAKALETRIELRQGMGEIRALAQELQAASAVRRRIDGRSGE